MPQSPSKATAGAKSSENEKSGQVADPLTLPAGDYELAISPIGAGIEGAVLTGTASVINGLNTSIMAYLSEMGEPGIAIFVNDTSAIAAGESRLIVRHTAAAPAGAGVEAAVFSIDGAELPEGTARIVYATGSLADRSFGLVVQDIAGLGETPGEVPTGDLSSSGLPLWFFLAAGLGLVALAGARMLATRRSR